MCTLILFWPGERTIPAIDRDEARFAEASRQMAASGDYVDIRFQDETRYKKPAGLYWLQSAAVKMLGENRHNPIWPYRLPSLLGAMGAVLATFLLARTMADDKTAWLAAGLLACSLLLNAEARLATADAALTCCTTLMLTGLYRIRRAATITFSRPGEGVILFWIALAAGLLLKGPVAPVLAGLCCLALSLRRGDRNPLPDGGGEGKEKLRLDLSWLRATRPVLGIGLVLLLVAPWLILIGLRSDGTFFRESLGHDFGAKITGARESHGGFPGLYLLEFPLAFWPGSLAALLAIPFIWTNRREAKVAFLLAWIVPNWVMFELVPTKLPHYILPLYPAIAILTSMAVRSKMPAMRRDWKFATTLLYVLVTSAIVAGFAIAAYTAPCGDILLCRVRTASCVDNLLCGVRVAGIVAALAVVITEIGVARRRWLAAGIACVAVYAAGFGTILPSLQAPFVARTMAEHRAAYDPALRHGTIALVGFHEPSAVLRFGPATDLTDPAGAAQALAEGRVVLAYVDQGSMAAFNSALHASHLDATPIDTIEGFNIARGRRVILYVFRAK